MKLIPGTRLCIETVFELLHPIQGNEVYETEDKDDEEEDWTDKLPADPPKHRWPRTNHLLHIITKPEPYSKKFGPEFCFYLETP